MRMRQDISLIWHLGAALTQHLFQLQFNIVKKKQRLEPTVVVNWHHVNKIELNS